MINDEAQRGAGPASLIIKYCPLPLPETVEEVKIPACFTCLDSYNPILSGAFTHLLAGALSGVVSRKKQSVS